MNRIYNWFEKERGIRRETLDAFGVRVDGQDVVFPYDTGEKTRRIHDDGRREFFFTKGHTPCLFHPRRINNSKVAFLCEGETDSMRLYQELRDDERETDVYGLSGVNTWRSALARTFEEYDRVLVLLDNDPDYNVAAQVDSVWTSIRAELGSRAKRIRLPAGTKDVCEFFGTYDLDTLGKLVKRNSVSRFKPLDFTRNPEPPNWLLDGFIAKGDTTLLSGREGLGKSFLTMGLAVAVAEGHAKFIGEKVCHHGRVLYIDQEQPEDDVHRRIHALGLSKAAADGTIRYLWDQRIRLDRNPDDLLEEAIDFQPELIVIDSLTRVHTQDENNAGQVAALFNDGITPLARQTGAAVVLIHHDNKSDEPRGSVDITASADNILHIRSVDNPSKFLLKQGKTRRRRQGEEKIIEILDLENGRISLQANAVITPPF